MATKIRLDKKELRFGRLLVGMNAVVLAFKEIAIFHTKLSCVRLVYTPVVYEG